jgi:hypothetical protein
LWGIWISRICAWPAWAISSAEFFSGAPVKPFSGISIFDWPEANQTSPIRTSSRTILLVAVTVSWYGPPAASGGRYTLQFPRLSPASVELDGHLFAGSRPAPDVDRSIALQHHVAAEDPGQFGLALSAARSAGQQEGGGKNANRCVDGHSYIVTRSACRRAS